MTINKLRDYVTRNAWNIPFYLWKYICSPAIAPSVQDTYMPPSLVFQERPTGQMARSMGMGGGDQTTLFTSISEYRLMYLMYFSKYNPNLCSLDPLHKPHPVFWSLLQIQPMYFHLNFWTACRNTALRKRVTISLTLSRVPCQLHVLIFKMATRFCYWEL